MHDCSILFKSRHHFTLCAPLSTCLSLPVSLLLSPPVSLLLSLISQNENWLFIFHLCVWLIIFCQPLPSLLHSYCISSAPDHHIPPKHTDLLEQCNFPQQQLKLRDLLNWFQIRLSSEASNTGDLIIKSRTKYHQSFLLKHFKCTLDWWQWLSKMLNMFVSYFKNAQICQQCISQYWIYTIPFNS